MPEKIPVRAVRNGGIDYVEVPTQDEIWIAAFRRERQGYLERGDAAGVALVDAELARLGAIRPPPASKPTEPASARKRSQP